ncbi:thiosulfate dehydrogenase [quinone] large subunit [Haloferula luteola]|uniref:Thiosulfate dehydrogenase [quinone] large subunit n=1 Tax=Haloferula luteola TaxID=595692 RepID=A0A840VF24_9BACT|nr:hypothetical protein [Haloferula luteola]MBB5353228.1 thiosulfate dehydrogenase [quinone] large subunit [Haloferula luteola]
MNAEEPKPDTLALSLGAMLARFWLAARAIQTGIEKYAGSTLSETAVSINGQPNTYGLTDGAATKGYALANYHGVPAALYDKFAGEPFMAGWALKLFDKTLGPALILLGVTILLGVASRISLFALGLLYIGLTWGLILIREDSGVAWLAAHMILIIAALALVRYDRLRILKKW